MLYNAIDQAWYRHKAVTLIAFDLKGAFNGVNWVSLDASLQARGIPMAARKWIASFMSHRRETSDSMIFVPRQSRLCTQG